MPKPNVFVCHIIIERKRERERERERADGDLKTWRHYTVSCDSHMTIGKYGEFKQSFAESIQSCWAACMISLFVFFHLAPSRLPLLSRALTVNYSVMVRVHNYTMVYTYEFMDLCFILAEILLPAPELEEVFSSSGPLQVASPQQGPHRQLQSDGESTYRVRN